MKYLKRRIAAATLAAALVLGAVATAAHHSEDATPEQAGATWSSIQGATWS